MAFYIHQIRHSAHLQLDWQIFPFGLPRHRNKKISRLQKFLVNLDLRRTLNDIKSQSLTFLNYHFFDDFLKELGSLQELFVQLFDSLQFILQVLILTSQVLNIVVTSIINFINGFARYYMLWEDLFSWRNLRHDLG